MSYGGGYLRIGYYRGSKPVESRSDSADGTLGATDGISNFAIRKLTENQGASPIPSR